MNIMNSMNNSDTHEPTSPKTNQHIKASKCKLFFFFFFLLFNIIIFLFLFFL